MRDLLVCRPCQKVACLTSLGRLYVAAVLPLQQARACRWDELHQVSNSCGNPQLKVECEWRLGMQEQLAATIKSASLADTPENGIAMCYSLALSDRSHELFAQTKIVTQRLQQEWSLLPTTAIDARIAMLQKTSQFVEVNEGAKVVQEIKHLFAGNQQPVCHKPHHTRSCNCSHSRPWASS